MAAIDEFLEGKYDSLFSCVKLNDACIWNDKESITYNYKDRQNRQDKKPLYLENGSLYIFSVKGIKEHENRLHGKIGRYVMESWQGFELDERDDIGICEFYMNRKILLQKEIDILNKKNMGINYA